MTARIDKESITIGSYGFNVPCRRFLVTANVTRDRRIPVVDEFLLRVLKLCERLPVKRLGAFFGFSTAETEAVMADLTARGMIEIEGDFASLHSSTKEMFRGSGDGVPRMIEVDTWVDRVWFDVVSRNMMSPERQRPLPNLINIRADSDAREMPISFVRLAFQDNFAEYLKRVRKINNPEAFGLYSVSDVQPERYGSVTIKGLEEIVFDPQPQIRPKLFEVGIENLARYRDLTNAMTDAYRHLWWPDPSSNGLDEFQRLSGDSSMAQSHQDQVFDLGGWLSRNEGIGKEWQPIVGASYLDKNVLSLINLIAVAPDPPTDAATRVEVPLVWIRPGGSAWGTSPDLQGAIAAIRGSIRAKSPKAALRTTVVMPSIIQREAAKRFNRIFDEGYIAPRGYFSPAIETILIGDMAALVSVRVAFSPTVSASVGFITINGSSVRRIKDGVRWESTRSRAEECWNTPRQKAEEETDHWTEGD
jgi:hypothetical protein